MRLICRHECKCITEQKVKTIIEERIADCVSGPWFVNIVANSLKEKVVSDAFILSTIKLIVEEMKKVQIK